MSLSSKPAVVYQISSNFDDFSYGALTSYLKMADVCHLEFRCPKWASLKL